jgi:HK97 gp10 family phage protein
VPYGDSGVTWRVVKDDSAAWSALLRQRVGIEALTFAQNVLAQAQNTVAVRSGATQESGTISEISVGSRTVYKVEFMGAALYLEFGTAHMPAQPFLSTAVAEMEGQFLARIAMTTQGRVVVSWNSVGNTQGFSDSYGG